MSTLYMCTCRNRLEQLVLGDFTEFEGFMRLPHALTGADGRTRRKVTHCQVVRIALCHTVMMQVLIAACLRLPTWVCMYACDSHSEDSEKAPTKVSVALSLCNHLHD